MTTPGDDDGGAPARVPTGVEGIPELGWLRERSPEYDTARGRVLSHVFAPETPTYPVKLRHVVAALVAALDGSPLTGHHMRKALDEGATVDEILEAIQVAERPGGATLLHTALTHLAEIEAERPVPPPT